jgi:DNA polymerase I-like protein with 3'-5' exonuclease and polymerase domains
VADLDRIEVVVLAWFLAKCTGDSKLLDIINSGEDVHSANAKNWGISRSMAKTVLFLLIYGGSANLIYKRGLTASLEEAERVFAQVHSNQPSIQRLRDMCLSKAKSRVHVDGVPVLSNPFGARGVYPELLSSNKWERLRGERQCFNFLIQKTARDVLHLLLIESLPCVELAGAAFVNVVHDEAIVEADEEKVPQLLQDLNRIWNNRMDILQGVRIHGEWHEGESWFEAK